MLLCLARHGRRRSPSRSLFCASLDEVKKKHKAALDQATKDLKEAKAREAAQQQQLSKLQKQHSKQSEAQKKMEDDARATASLLEQTNRENKRLRADLDAMLKGGGGGGGGGSSAPAGAEASPPAKPSFTRRISSSLFKVRAGAGAGG